MTHGVHNARQSGHLKNHMFVGEAHIPAGKRIYAIGDIHGCTSLLVKMFDAIGQHLSSYPVGEHRIITLGDYCDRGQDSKGTIEYLIERQKDGNLICLMGNHDQRMIEFINSPAETGEIFMRFGGGPALVSYGIDIEGELDFRSIARELKSVIPRSHLSFLNNLELMHEEGDYVFAHAGIRPGVALEEQEPKDLLWIRNTFLNHEGSFGKVVVHGHTISDEFDTPRNRINVDTGAYETGRLTCAVLENDTVEKLQVKRH